ncbi:membrane-bound lytic murein transglycosylase MltF [Zhongshania aquimaris]|uniref:Membrane-bound lytic murein transglycosylase MltF n=1 Tax=Zhongshania aquimaris TaxID=2857107 RepID=A0ABS6VQG7_9GAMM|nr:membrane-bound lytic murein transglycosylase MltF [Zhongshania aquimaris]MBW2940569.1 membrane-bound lytic murein transglycosylase MltF [Zhongshania aquimaris]
MRKKPIISTLATLVCLTLAGCGNDGSTANGKVRAVSDIKASGELRVLMRNAPTIYYLDKYNHPAGPEYQMAEAFAEHLGVKLVVVLEETINDTLTALKAGKADMAASGLTITDQRKSQFLFTKQIESVTEQLVCRRGGNVAKSLEQLSKVSIEVVTGSSYEETLETLKLSNPQLSWKSNTQTGTEALLQKVWNSKIDCTIADSTIVDVNRRFMPELIVLLDVSKPKSQAWMMPNSGKSLKSEADTWLNSSAGKAIAKTVHNRYYSYIEQFDFVDIRTLTKRIEDRLPKYESIFAKAAKTHNIDESLMAAQAYQESHWDAQAKSPTGVRGIMMLTQNTAKSLGVKDRLNPKEAIPAGALYLDQMREKFDEAIPEPDRTYMALAAYNIGRAHMHDAQTLARKLGKDPKKWSDLREVLPMLSDKRYYKDLKYGYARGLEPVRYVQRIRNYEDIIKEYDN